MNDRRSVLTRIVVVLAGLPMLVVCVMMLMACLRLLFQEPEHGVLLLLGMAGWHLYWAGWLMLAVSRAMGGDSGRA